MANVPSRLKNVFGGGVLQALHSSQKHIHTIEQHGVDFRIYPRSCAEETLAGHWKLNITLLYRFKASSPNHRTSCPPLSQGMANHSPLTRTDSFIFILDIFMTGSACMYIHRSIEIPTGFINNKMCEISLQILVYLRFRRKKGLTSLKWLDETFVEGAPTLLSKKIIFLPLFSDEGRRKR